MCNYLYCENIQILLYNARGTLQVTESNRNKEVDNQSNTSDGSERYTISQKRKLSSPALSPALPNKVIKLRRNRETQRKEER